MDSTILFNASSLLLLLLIVFSLQAPAKPNDGIIRIVTEHLPPYQISRNNDLIGGSVGKEVSELIDIVLPTSKVDVMPWARAYEIALHQPNTLIFSLVRTPEREDKFIWIGKVAHVTTRLISLRDTDIDPVDNLEDLSNIQIGVKRQDAVANFLNQNGFEFERELVEIVNTISTMKMLERHRIDAIPANRHIIQYYCKKTGCETSDFKTIYTFKGLSEEFYLAASLGTDPSIIKQLKEEFANLKLPID